MTSHAKQLLDTYGPIVGGRDLRKLLGYRSPDAFRQAVARNTLPIQTFRQRGRRERLARTVDVASWLAQVDQELAADNNRSEPKAVAVIDAG